MTNIDPTSEGSLSALGMMAPAKPSGLKIKLEQLSPGSRQVLEKLSSAGFDAFIVGGAVRDLLLSTKPHDFDLATNASVEQILALFPEAIEAGERFRIVILVVGDETVEIATLRPFGKDAPSRQHFPKIAGSTAEDAVQRDFTVNALYFLPVRGEVLDFTGGLQDLQAGLIRPIGDAEFRFRDDPLLMLRAIRFARKLGFAIDPAAREVMPSLGPLLAHVTPNRLVAEIVRHLKSGKALACIEDMCCSGLHAQILPHLGQSLLAHVPFLRMALNAIDETIAANEKVSTAFLFAALYWPFAARHFQRQRMGTGSSQARAQPAFDAVVARAAQLPLPRELTEGMLSIWSMQPHFECPAGGPAPGLMAHPRFSAGYNLLQLRCAAGEADASLVNQWGEMHRNIRRPIDKAAA